MKLLTIVIAVCFTTIAAFFYLRFTGLHTDYQIFDHPFFPAGQRLWLLDPGPEQLSVEAMQPLFNAKMQETLSGGRSVFGLVVHLLPQPDGVWIWKVGGQNRTMNDLVEMRQIPILFVIEDFNRVEPIQAQRQIKAIGVQAPFAISCGADRFLEKFRELEPAWAFGGGQSELTRLSAMTSLWVEPMLNLKSDFFIFPYRWHGIQLYQPRALDEIRRRHKRFFIGPINNEDQLEQTLEIKPDGIILDSSALFSQQS